MRHPVKTTISLLASLLFCIVAISCSTPTKNPIVDTATIASPTFSPSPTPSPTPEPTPIISTVTFSASGDNLIHKSLYEDAATKATQAGLGDAYDFTYAYENAAYFFENYDVNWINQETLVSDTITPSTYPTFCSPGEIAHKLYEIGFTVFSLSNNHTYDKGAAGIDSTLAFWDSMPDDVVTCGLWDEETDASEIPLHEVNGITLAYLSYTFSTNGIPTPSNAVKTVIYTTETERIQSQMELANSLADVVIVSVHWGTENSHSVHSSQQTLAQNLTDWGADLIIGTHPHVLQDCEWLTAEDGSPTFVAYSLGNFVSAQSVADNLVGGVLTLTFQKTIELDGSIDISIIDPKITPVVTHYDWGYDYPRIYLWRDYTPELAAIHGVQNYDNRFTYDYISQVINNNISAEFLTATADTTV